MGQAIPSFIVYNRDYSETH